MSAPVLTLIEGGAGRRQTIWCERLPGFGLRRHSSASASWIVQTRIGARTRTVTLGRASLLSESKARDLARHVLLRAQIGDDPAADRLRTRVAPAFDDFVAEYWAKAKTRWKPTTRVRNDEHRRCHLLGRFSGKFIDGINPADVRRWFVTISDECGPGTANRAAAVLNNMMRSAERWGYRQEGSNPCAKLKRNRPRRCARVLEPDELSRLGTALDELQTAQPQAVTVIRLLLLTGCRVSEILTLEWDDVRGERLRLRDAKAGPRTVWLGEQAIAVFNALPRRRGEPVIFCSPERRAPLASPRRFWLKLLRHAGLPPTRLHDLRHTFASYGARGAETMPMIGRLLGHRHMGSTSRYTRLDDKSLLGASDLIGSAIWDSIEPSQRGRCEPARAGRDQARRRRTRRR